MMEHLGPSSLSASKKEKLITLLKQEGVFTSVIQGTYVHYVHEKTPLSPSDKIVIEGLLSYGHSEEQLAPSDQILTFYVTPRRGTISPWSTKATDIARSCGFENKIHRIDRGVQYRLHIESGLLPEEIHRIKDHFYDKMLEDFHTSKPEMVTGNGTETPRPLVEIDVRSRGKEALRLANNKLGLALSDDEIDYLLQYYQSQDTNPTDVELMMFAQANSEHCRHKIFNASWEID